MIPQFLWELNIMSKEADSGLGFYTLLVSPRLLHVIFNYSKIGFEKENLTHFLQSCRKMDFGFNNVVLTTFA